MKIAVSNIAWDAPDSAAAYQLLQQYGVKGLEIAPGNFLHGASDVFQPDEGTAGRALEAASDAGLQLVSMQSVLFGVQGAALFGDAAERATFKWAMQRAIALAGRFRIPNIVFGSPRQRNIPSTIATATASAIAATTFRELGDAAAAVGCVIAIEPNPTVYGTNFLNTVAEADAFVASVQHPAITLNLDIGAMLQNATFDEIESVAARTISRISHVHISEPLLAPAPASAQQATRVFRALSAANYTGWYAIEIKRPPGATLDVLENSLLQISSAVMALQGIHL